MQDIMDIVSNIEDIYGSNTAFGILKDFERVLDELDLYVFANWEDGELAMGPKIERYWVTCGFMWPRDQMPDPMGGMRLVDYDCKVRYKKDFLIVPRKIKKPGDIRPNTKKGKLDRVPVWFVEIQMPKTLIIDIMGGSKTAYTNANALDSTPVRPESQDSENMVDLTNDPNTFPTGAL